MSNKKTKRAIVQDRKLVAIRQRYEVALIAHNLKKTQKEIRDAIAKVGHSRAAIVNFFDDKKYKK